MSLENAVKSGKYQIIDVRSQGEYVMGNIEGSKNIPLNEIPKRIAEFNKEEAILLCCASGMRSGSAEQFFKQNGFTNAYNGGGWRELKSVIGK